MKQIKIVSIITAIMLIILALPMGTSVSAATSTWDGTTITQPTSMKTINGVYYYEISTAEELAYIAQTGGDWLGYNYILANDITLNSVELTYDANGNLTVNASALNQWTPIDGLNGIFNGNGFSVSGVYINSNSDYVGLFSEFGEEGEIKNLTVKNSYIKGKNKVGGICGYTKANVTNCFFDGAIIGNSYVAALVGYSVWNTISDCGNDGDIWGTGTYVSGIVSGDTSFGPVSISNCYNKGNIISTGNYTAGITAATDANYFSNCTNAGNIVGVNYVGGLVAKMEDVSLNNGANLGNISGENYVGGIAGYSTNRSGATYWDSTITNSYNSGTIAGNSNVGGIAGYTSYGNVYNSYNIGNVVGTTSTGAVIGHSESIWGKGTVSGCYYLKSTSVNINLTAFGNTNEDAEGAISKDDSFFCINSDKTLNKNGHTYSNGCDTTCNICQSLRETQPHKYDSGVVTKAATCKATGVKTYTCTVCEATKTSTIAKLTTHKYTDIVTKATLTKNGSIVKKCSVCGNVASTTTINYVKSFALTTTSYTYNGSARTPGVIVKDSAGKVLKNKTDYTVSYAGGRTNVGTYKVTVTMKGNYSGTKTLYFKINPASYSKCKFALTTTNYTYNGALKTPGVTIKYGSLTLKKNVDYTVAYSGGRKNIGTYKVTVKMKGNYTGTKTLTFKINPKIKLSATSYTYDGKTKTPTVTVTNSAGTKLSTKYYTVSYSAGRKNVGTYTATIKFKNGHSGTYKYTFKINPPKTTVSKLTAGKKSITVAISKKSSQVTGYQVQYSTSKSFSKPVTKTISSYKTTKYTLKSLSAKKTYYVRVRTYKTVGKTKYYSGWSTYKYVKTK